MKVYREGKEIFEIKDYKQVGSFMNVATIEATVKIPTPFVFKVGDYVIFDYNGLTYTLYNVAPEKKQARSGTYGEAFIYELKFKADTEQLAICPFLDLVANDNGLHYTSLPSFSTYENIYGIVARLQANMDYLYPNKWRFNVVDTTDEALMELLNEPREFSISGESCFDGLKKIYDIWGVSFIHTFENDINVITIGKSAGTTSVFRYGKGQGLRTIKKNIQNSEQLCTRAYVYGSTRNIPALWYNEKGYIGEAQYAPNLMIPPSKWIGGVPQGAYIDAIFGDDNRIEKYGLRIKTLNYDGSDNNKEEIFPSIERVTAYDIRQAKEELGQTTLVPSASYADNERMDYILEGSNIDDDGIGSEAGYVIYSDKIFSDIQGQYMQISIGELMPEGYYKPVAVQKSMTLCSFEVTKTANYRISEIVDLVTFQKNESRSIVSASLILQKPSGEYISLGQFSFSDKIKGSLKLSENGNIEATEAGTYSIVLKFNVSWDSNAILPESVGGITLDYFIKASTVTFSRGLNIMSNFFEIKIKQIGFNLNDVTSSGQFKTIHIKSGMCAGRSFNITQCKYSESDDSWVLTCRRIIDNSISQRFPNNIFPIAKDDQFILLNIHMPDIYIHTAMQRLYNTALADLRHLSKPQYVIEPEIDNIQMARSPQTLKEGMYMPIEDADISYIDDTLIDSVTITNKEKELRTFQVTLRSDKIINTFSKLASRISDLESSLQEAESKANISQAQDNDDSKINEGNTGGGSSTGLDESALQQYLTTNQYTTVKDVTDSIKPVSDKVDEIEADVKTLADLGFTLKTYERDGETRHYVESKYNFIGLEDIVAGGGEIGEDASGGIIQQVYGVSAFGQNFDANNLTDTFNAHAINSLYKDIQTLKNSGGGGVADSVDWANIYNKPTTLAGYGITDALPLSGGTISSTTTATPLAINSTDATQTYMTIRNNGVAKGAVGYRAAGFGAFIYNFVPSSYLGIQDDATPYYYYNGGVYPLIHSGNIGSQSVNYATSSFVASRFPCKLNKGFDANSNEYLLLSDYGSGGPKYNIPDGFGYGSIFTPLPSNGETSLLGQFAWGINHNTSTPTRKLWFRASNNLGWGNDWKTIAFTDSNVASATKLQTARTIWGQSFDGTQNVSGKLSNATAIAFDTDCGVYQGSTFSGSMSKYDIAYYGTNHYFHNFSSGYNLIIKENGNVLMGTTTDNGNKLQVCQSNTTNGDVALFESNASWNTLVLRLNGAKGWSFGCNTSEQFYFYSHTNGTVAYIDKNGTYVGVGDVTAGSDVRYKSKIQDIAIDVATIANAPLFSYKWNDREDKDVHLGTTAQYWMDTNFKDAVNTNNPDFYHLNYGALGVAIGVSVAKKVVNHEERIAVLERENKELREELKEYRRA